MKTLIERCPLALDSLTLESRARAESMSSYSDEEVSVMCYICKKTFRIKARNLSNATVIRCFECRYTIPFGDYLYERRPDLEREWGLENRRNFKQVWFLSAEKMNWICSVGHVWRATSLERFNGRECTVCFGVKQVKVKDGFLRNFPKLKAEWSAKNEVNPSRLSVGSKKKVIWECSNCSNVWTTSIIARTRVNASGCPQCARSQKRSKGEVEMCGFLESNGIMGSITDRTVISPFELDFISFNLKRAVEYNGDYFHSDKSIRRMHNMTAFEYHSMKKDLSRKAGFDLVFVWESDWISNRKVVESAVLEFFITGSKQAILKKLDIPILSS